jgi:hypothetical protein
MTQKLNWERVQVENRIAKNGSTRLGVNAVGDYPRCPFCLNVLRDRATRTLNSHLRRRCSKYTPPPPEPAKAGRNPNVAWGAKPITEYLAASSFPQCLRGKLIKANKKFGGRVVWVSEKYMQIKIMNPLGEVELFDIDALIRKAASRKRHLDKTLEMYFRNRRMKSLY